MECPMRHSRHTHDAQHHGRRHERHGFASTDLFSLHALWHAFGRPHHRAEGRSRGHDGHGRGERGQGDFQRGLDGMDGAARGFAHLDRFSLHALWHAIGRHHHRGGPGGGRFQGGPGGFGGGDGDGFPRGRKFTSDDLQLLLLALLDAQPSHGYELIKALETRSNGFYSPSPGMVYPALTYLEEIGFVTVQLEGNRKRYELADAGRQHLADNRERAEMMLAKLNHIARKMDSVRRAFAGEEPLDPSEGGWLPELIEARRALKHALFRRDNVPADEQRRIAAILARATAEIEGKPDAG